MGDSLVVIEYSAYAVRYGNEGASSKTLPQGRLDQLVCIAVHLRRGFVKDDHPRPTQQGTGQAG